MPNITPMRDDLSVRNSIIKSKQSNSVSAVNKTQSYPTAESNVQSGLPPQGGKSVFKRRKGDRRKNSRRLKRQNVLLDTRNNRERRKNDRRNTQYKSKADYDASLTTSRGIDIYS